MKTLILCLLSIGGLLAQSTPPNQLQIYSPAPSPVRQIGGGTVGQSGSTTLYYWVIARYSSGVAVNTTPVAIFNTVGTANLTASNYVSVTWGAVGGATGYDVLRSTTPIYPANPTCTACAVALNTPNSSVADTGAALSDYPPAGLVQSSSTTATIYLDNSNSVPYLNTQLLYRATENLIVGLISGSIANGDCLEYYNGRIVSAGAACGSGSGGASLPYPGIAVGLTSSTSIARTLVGSDSSISIANPDGTTGNPDLSTNTGIISSREQVQLGSSIYALTTGTSTAYLCGLTPAATVGFLDNGTSVRLKIDETSGAAPVTLSCDGSAAKTIYKRNGTTAAAQVTTGELIANQIYNFDYDTSLNGGAGGWLTDIGGGSSSGTTYTKRIYFPAGFTDKNGATNTSGVFGTTAAKTVSNSAGDSGVTGMVVLPDTVQTGILTSISLADWSGSGNISVKIFWTWNGAGGSDGVWRQSVGTVCTAVGETLTAPGSFNAVEATSSSSPLSDRLRTDTLTASTTGCATGELMGFNIFRVAGYAGTTTGDISLVGVEISYTASL